MWAYSGGYGSAHRGDVIGLSTVFEQQRNNVRVALLRRLVEWSVTHLHTINDMSLIVIQGLKVLHVNVRHNGGY